MKYTKADWIQAFKTLVLASPFLAISGLLMFYVEDYFLSNIQPDWLGYVLVFIFYLVFTGPSFNISVALSERLYVAKLRAKYAPSKPPEDNLR